MKKGLEKTVFLLTAISALSFGACERKSMQERLVIEPIKISVPEECVPIYALENLTNEEMEKLVSEGKAINYISKLKWDLDDFKGYEILYQNPGDGAVFPPEEQNLIETVLNHFYVDGKKFPVQKDTELDQQLKNNYSLIYLPIGIDGGVMLSPYPKKNWIIIAPYKYLGKAVGCATPIKIYDYLLYDKGMIQLKEGKIKANPYLLLHELTHLFISLEEPTEEENEQLISFADIAEKWLKE